MSETALFATMAFPEIYERFLVAPLFRPFAEDMITRLRPGAGDSLIDVACGTGIVARIARTTIGPTARIVGIDMAAPMLAVARANDSTIEWREGNATALPVDNERFSLLTCHQGLQFFPDKPAAVREMRRVLAPGGHLAIGTWKPLADSPLINELHLIAETHLGPIADSRHSFGDADAIAALLNDAAFTDIRVETSAHDIRMPDGALFARLNASALTSMSATGKTLSATERDTVIGRVVSDSMSTIGKYTKDGGLVFALATNVATARV